MLLEMARLNNNKKIYHCLFVEFCGVFFGVCVSVCGAEDWNLNFACVQQVFYH